MVEESHEMRRPRPAAAKVTFRLLLWGLAFVLLSAVCAAVLQLHGRDVRTRHETPMPESLRLQAADGLSAEARGCIAQPKEAGADLCLRAVTLTPSVEIASSADAAKRVVLHVVNAPHSRIRVTGGTLLDAAPDANSAAIAVDVPAGGRQRVTIEPSDAEGPMTFYVFGDTSDIRTYLDRILADAAREKPAFLFCAGDLASRGRRSGLLKHRDAVKGLAAPYFSAIGNHDIEGKTLSAPDYTTLFAPTYYAFAYRDCFFVVLDNALYYISEQQLKWLRETLAGAQGYAHRFVFAHMLPFDPRKGRMHNMKPGLSGAQALERILAASNVDVFFCGHVHTYAEEWENGARYVITGGGGSSMTEPFPYYHYVRVTVDGPDVALRLRLLDDASQGVHRED